MHITGTKFSPLILTVGDMHTVESTGNTRDTTITFNMFNGISLSRNVVYHVTLTVVIYVEISDLSNPSEETIQLIGE